MAIRVTMRASTKARRFTDGRESALQADALRRVARPLVLVSDDNADARIIYSSYLKAMGCEAYTASAGRTAVQKAIELLPDIIVMDLAMPYLDGWEAMRRLRDSSWTRRIRIVAVSGAPASRLTAFEAGCDAYLEKPCEPQVLWWQIRALLDIPATV